MSGFDNEVVYCEGIDLTNNPGSISNQLATDGFIYFGNTAGRPQAGLPTSSDSSITITPGAGTLDLTIAGGGTPWIVVTAATQALSVDNGYIGNRGTAITYTLPATSAVGGLIRITNIGAGLPVIAQNALQSINFTATTTTVGVGGSLTAVEQFASIELVCVVADLQWCVLNSTGNFTIV